MGHHREIGHQTAQRRVPAGKVRKWDRYCGRRARICSLRQWPLLNVTQCRPTSARSINLSYSHIYMSGSIGPVRLAPMICASIQRIPNETAGPLMSPFSIETRLTEALRTSNLRTCDDEKGKG